MSDKLIPVRILRSFGAYAPGEIAGFVRAKVTEFVKANAVEEVQVDDDGNVVEAETPSEDEADEEELGNEEPTATPRRKRRGG